MSKLLWRCCTRAATTDIRRIVTCKCTSRPTTLHRRGLLHHGKLTNLRKVHILVSVPPMAESINEGTLSRLTKQIGDSVEIDEEIASIETDKIDISVNAPQAGVVNKFFVSEGDTVIVGQHVAQISTEDGEKSDLVRLETTHEKRGAQIAEHTPPNANALGTDTHSKHARNTTQEAPRIETRKSQKKDMGSKPLESENIKAEPRERRTPMTNDGSRTAGRMTEGPSPEISAQPNRNERLERMPRIRKTIAQRLKQSQSTTASLTVMQELDMSALIRWRKQSKEDVMTRYGIRLGYMGAFVKATTLAAQQVATINTSMDLERGEITFKDYVDVSIAVSTPKGLVTPVICDCHTMSIVEIEEQVSRLAVKARDGKLGLEDLRGGNFTISNPGIFGSMFGTPVINYPQSAVFNMNTIADRVIAVESQAVVRPMMYVTLTYDARLIEERDAVDFLRLLKDYIEEPSRMLAV